jgi:AmiR/NasT family two-component response regulator
VGDLPNDGRYDEYEAEDYQRHIEGVTSDNDRLVAANVDLSSDNDDLTAENLRLARENDGLNIALDHRAVIGQAMGILMERHKMKAEEAFDLLVAVSQNQNVKLFTLAERLARTGDLG